MMSSTRFDLVANAIPGVEELTCITQKNSRTAIITLLSTVARIVSSDITRVVIGAPPDFGSFSTGTDLKPVSLTLIFLIILIHHESNRN